MIKSSYERAFLFILGLSLVFLRIPNLFIKPRFWAEEGSVYYQYAILNNWLDGLTSAHFGYYYLYANLATVLAAKLVSIEQSPFITTLFSAGVFVWLIYLITHKDSIFREQYQKILAVLSVVIFPIYGGWLSVVHSQFYFATAAVIILLMPVNKTTTVGLFFGGLSGIPSLFITPMFLWKAWKEKDKKRFFQAIILCLCLIVQLAAHTPKQQATPAIASGLFRENTGLINVAAIISSRSILYNLLPPSILQKDENGHVGEKIISALSESETTTNVIIKALLIIGVILILLFLWKVNLTLFYCYILLMILSIFVGRPPEGKIINYITSAHRYFMPANSVLLFSLIFSIEKFKENWRKFFLCLTSFLFLVNFIYFFFPPEKIKQGPDWKQEVENWRTGKQDAVRIWPTINFPLNLPPELRKSR